jgi:hypothetical protein
MRRIALAALAVSLLVPACGDDDDAGGALTVEEYFTRLEAAGTEFAERGEAADAELTESEDPVGDAKLIIPEFIEILEDFVEVLDGLSPPAEVAEAHGSTVAAGKDALAALRDAAGEVADVDDLGGLVEFFEGPAMSAFEAAGARFEAGCAQLEGLAEEQGLDVDLRCDG